MFKRLFHSASIRVLIGVCCLAIVTAPTAAAQEGESDTPAPKNSLKDGAWALQFQIGENFSLHDFQGMTISGKHHISSKSAMRLGVELNFHHSTGESEFDGTAPFFEYELEEYKSEGNQTEVRAQYIYYSSVDKKMNLYLGSGPYLRFTYDFSHSTKTLPDSGNIVSYRRWRRDFSWSAGVSWVLGVEWLVASNIALSGEYALNSSYAWRRYRYKEFRLDPDREETRNSSTGSWNINPSPIRFGLTLYF